MYLCVGRNRTVLANWLRPLRTRSRTGRATLTGLCYHYTTTHIVGVPTPIRTAKTGVEARRDIPFHHGDEDGSLISRRVVSSERKEWKHVLASGHGSRALSMAVQVHKALWIINGGTIPTTTGVVPAASIVEAVHVSGSETLGTHGQCRVGGVEELSSAITEKTPGVI